MISKRLFVVAKPSISPRYEIKIDKGNLGSQLLKRSDAILLKIDGVSW